MSKNNFFYISIFYLFMYLLTISKFMSDGVGSEVEAKKSVFQKELPTP